PAGPGAGGAGTSSRLCAVVRSLDRTPRVYPVLERDGGRVARADADLSRPSPVARGRGGARCGREAGTHVRDEEPGRRSGVGDGVTAVKLPRRSPAPTATSAPQVVPDVAAEPAPAPAAGSAAASHTSPPPPLAGAGTPRLSVI